MDFRRLDRSADRFLPFFLWAVRIAFGAAIVLSLLRLGSTELFFASAGLIATFYAHVLKRTPHVFIPATLQILLVLNILVAAALAGSVFHVYEAIFWWDDFTHFWAGFLFFVAAYGNLLHLQRMGKVQGSNTFFRVVAASISLSLEALWEIIELIAVFFTGFKLGAMQLNDTPIDIVDNFFGMLAGVILVVLIERQNS
ncbi:MAG: hypothetical protein ACOC0U_04530 [Desulfovibrionales bacterium]